MGLKHDLKDFLLLFSFSTWKILLYLPPVFQRNGEGTVSQECVCSQGGEAHLHPTIFPSSGLIPFQGVMPGPGPMSLPRGYPHPIPDGEWGVPHPVPDREVPWPGQDGVSPWMGVPPVKTGWEYPSGRQSSRVSTFYLAGSMLLAFTQEDFFVINLETIKFTWCARLLNSN